MSKLTKKQRERIAYIVSLPGVRLYKETSLSGASETLRYRWHRTEQTPWGKKLRTESGMVLSVKIKVLDSGRDDPNSLAKYRALCSEAEQLFHELRTERHEQSQAALNPRTHDSYPSPIQNAAPLPMPRHAGERTHHLPHGRVLARLYLLLLQRRRLDS